jgi:hypothetical protein
MADEDVSNAAQRVGPQVTESKPWMFPEMLQAGLGFEGTL